MRQYAADLNEIKRLGGDGVITPSDRTARPDRDGVVLARVAHRWRGTGSARSLATSHHLDLWESARLFGLLDAALADGYIASFHTKYDVYRFWRPVTAIRLADTDGNPATVADPTWTPLATTPPIPDYESAHSVEGALPPPCSAGSSAPGTCRSRPCSYTLDAASSCTGDHPVWRWYDGPAAASAENGVSRILVGFHFRLAVEPACATATTSAAGRSRRCWPRAGSNGSRRPHVLDGERAGDVLDPRRPADTDLDAGTARSRYHRVPGSTKNPTSGLDERTSHV